MRKAWPAFVFSFLYIIGFALADVNVTTEIYTNGTLNAEIIQVGGNITSNEYYEGENITTYTWVNSTSFRWYINGYPGDVPEYHYHYTKGLSWDSLISQISNAVDYILGLTNYVYEDALEFLNQLKRIFFTREEGEELQRQIDEIMTYYEFRIASLEKAVQEINQTAYCNGRISVMFEYNLSYVKCGNVTYYNMQVANKRYAVTIEPLE